MSLLIKALQKAEQSKEHAAASPDAPSPAPGGLALELAPHHDDHHHDVSLAEEGGFTDPLPKPAKATPAVETPAPPPAKPAPATLAVEREAAANVFMAKGDAVGDPGSRRAFWLGIVGLTLLLLLGGGFYFYLESLQQPELVAVRPLAPPPAVKAPPAPAQTAALPSPPIAPVAADTPPASAPVAEPKLPETSALPVPPNPAPVAAAPQKSPAADNENVKVTRNRKSEPTSNATAVAAYQAFMAGDDAAAGRLYRQLLQADPRSIDALLGLAAVSARQDKPEEAASHYTRALEFEPRNSVAQAGLIALMSQADPVTAESKLKSLLAQQPDAAYLHAALGSVYAEQNQWPSAQQSYFEAFRLEPGSAEHAYNLAISLDQIAKKELALDYYQKSRDLLPQQGGSIDRAALESRINQLRSALGK